jgi:hypothetical protein
MRKFILMLALFSATLCANAQIATENSYALDNIGVGVTGGVSTPLDFNSVFPLNTNVGLKFTKDFTPAFGFQVEGLAFLNDNHFTDIKTSVKATNVGLNGALNLSNVFGGYKGTPRKFEVSAIAGIGWLHTWTTSNNYLSSKTGLDFAWNIGKKKAHSLVLTPAIYWNLHKFGDIQFDKRGSQLALNVSYVYHFKTSNGTHHFKTWDVGAMNDEINYLRGALDECQRQHLVDTVVTQVVVEKPIFRVVEKVNEWTVEFAFNSAELTNDAKAVLNSIGQDGIVDVFGYASPEGSEAYNKELSQRRANAVADYLKNRGVRVNKAIGEGAKLNRIVIVKPAQ